MDSHQARLDRQGYAVLPDFMGAEFLDRILRPREEELFAEEGDRAGGEFRKEPNARRLANLVDKGEVFREAIARPEILGLVEYVLGPGFKLSSLNVRSADPNSNSLQPLHIDMGLLPDEKGNAVCNTVWMLDDFTLENGALRVVAGSHGIGINPSG